VVTAERGVVQSTVSASGTVQAATSVGLDFKSGGRLLQLYVSPGRHVIRGELLAIEDPIDARSALQQAQDNLDSAQARLLQVTQVLSPQERAQDTVLGAQSRAQVSASQRAYNDAALIAGTDQQTSRAAVAQAQLGLARTQQSAVQDGASQQGTVNSDLAQRNFDQNILTADQTQTSSDQSQLSTDQATLNNDLAPEGADASQVSADQSQLESDQSKQFHDGCPSGGGGGGPTCQSDAFAVSQDQSRLTSDQAKLSQDKANVQTDQSKIASDQSKIASDQSKLTSDQGKLLQDSNGITSAQNAASLTAVKDQQSVDAARNALTNARNAEGSTRTKDQQSTHAAANSLNSAREALNATLAANGVKGQPPKPGDLAAAQTSVEIERLAVQSAQRTLADTRLYSPVNGVIASVSTSPPAFVSGGGPGGGSSSTSVGTSSSGGGGSSSGSGASSGGSSSTGSSGGSGASSGSSGAGASSGSGGAGASSGSGASGSSSAGGGSGSSGGSSGSGGSSSSSGSSAANSFITVTGLHGLQIVAPFSETDAARIQLDQSATVSVDALPGQQLAAHVIAIAPTATSSAGVVTYNVTLQLDQTASGLKPGMTGSAQVVVQQVEGAINVPAAALSRSGGSQVVTVVRNGKQVQVPVVVGLRGDNSVQIVSGLNEGAQVAIQQTSFSARTGLSGTGTGGGLGGGGLGGGGLGGGGLGGGGLGGGGGGGRFLGGGPGG
jgi:macrolide-specific efflux system membrane fusion protein